MYIKEKWSQITMQKIWEKGKIVLNNDPKIYRRDACGAWMKFNDHGDREAKYGWEIDHIHPESLGGTDELNNLQPLHWKNNVKKGDSPILKCEITN